MTERPNIGNLSEDKAHTECLVIAESLSSYRQSFDSRFTRGDLGGRAYFVETTDREDRRAFAVQEELGRRGIYEWSFWSFTEADNTPEYKSKDRFRDKSDSSVAWRSMLKTLRALQESQEKGL